LSTLAKLFPDGKYDVALIQDTFESFSNTAVYVASQMMTSVSGWKEKRPNVDEVYCRHISYYIPYLPTTLKLGVPFSLPQRSVVFWWGWWRNSDFRFFQFGDMFDICGGWYQSITLILADMLQSQSFICVLIHTDCKK